MTRPHEMKCSMLSVRMSQRRPVVARDPVRVRARGRVRQARVLRRAVKRRRARLLRPLPHGGAVGELLALGARHVASVHQVREVARGLAG